MSFHEKSAWACLVSIVVVCVPYLALVLQYPMSFVGLLPLAVLAQVVLVVGFQIVNAIATRSIRMTGGAPGLDELDRWIELRAAKWSGFVLAFVVMSWILLALVGAPMVGIKTVGEAAGSTGLADLVIPLGQALMAIHVLFAGFVVANVVYYGLIVAGYRGLARG